jgi:hypothetical protein
MGPGSRAAVFLAKLLHDHLVARTVSGALDEQLSDYFLTLKMGVTNSGPLCILQPEIHHAVLVVSPTDETVTSSNDFRSASIETSFSTLMPAQWIFANQRR